MNRVQKLLQSCGVDIGLEEVGDDDSTASELTSLGKKHFIKTNFLRDNFEEIAAISTLLPCGCCCDAHHSVSFHDGRTGALISCGSQISVSEEVLIAAADVEDAELCLDADPEMYLGSDAFMSSIVSLQTDFNLGCFHSED